MPEEIIPEEVMTPPLHLNAKAAETWVEYTEKYGNPQYMEPFWFWDNGKPFGAKEDRNSVGFMGSKDPVAIHASSVWNKTAIADLSIWGSSSPAFLEDGRGITPNVPNVPNVPETPEDIARREKTRETAKEMSESMKRWALVYVVVGFSSAAILINKYKKKFK